MGASVGVLVGLEWGLWFGSARRKVWPEPRFGGGFGRAALKNRGCVVGE